MEHSPFTHILKKAVFSDWSIQPVGSMYAQKTIQMMMVSLTTQKRVLEWIQIQTTPMGRLGDFDEVYTYYTDGTDPDSDGDGVNDGDEVALGIDPSNQIPMVME